MGVIRDNLSRFLEKFAKIIVSLVKKGRFGSVTITPDTTRPIVPDPTVSKTLSLNL